MYRAKPLTGDVKELMGTGSAYCENARVVVRSSAIADQYMTADSLGSLSFSVENGCAGMEALDAPGIALQTVAIPSFPHGNVIALLIEE